MADTAALQKQQKRKKIITSIDYNFQSSTLAATHQKNLIIVCHIQMCVIEPKRPIYVPNSRHPHIIISYPFDDDDDDDDDDDVGRKTL
jgi:hypothetical protein